MLDVIDGVPNTPANDFWTILIIYSRNANLISTSLQLVFQTDGNLDWNRTSEKDYQMANTLLMPLISQFYLRANVQGIDLNFWKFIALAIAASYWLLLADIGQDCPLIYSRSTYYLPDFASAIQPTANNNIFANNTLFSISTSFLSNTLLPFLDLSPKGFTKFAPLDSQNRFYPTDRMILRNYNCIERRGKEPISALISVASASYVLIYGVYSLVLVVAGLYQKWNNPQGNFSSAEG